VTIRELVERLGGLPAEDQALPAVIFTDGIGWEVGGVSQMIGWEGQERVIVMEIYTGASAYPDPPDERRHRPELLLAAHAPANPAAS
jgi:hypothetical protein